MPEYSLDCSLARETRAKLDDFTFAYVEAAMWTLTDESGESMNHLGLHDIAEETIVKAIADCQAFRTEAGALLDGAEDSQVGHDFWLTRNGHGTGFWDRALHVYPNDPEGARLTEIAKRQGSADWYVGDDGLVYQY
jgi:hypothetical protein